ncbi:MAG: hypothetical protein HY288_08670 [Planctomycetia bacterium]|nr:hypothetical protein [Planctomycetia bacterium]
MAAQWLVAVADDLTLSPQPGILLLHNGEMIEGAITAAGDRYDVNLKDGEIHVPRSSVAIVCRTIEECYLHRRAGIAQERVQDHLELAEWCLRNRLLESAEKELADARTADAGHPKIRLLEVRLKLSKESPKSTEPINAPEKNVSKEQLDRLVRNLPAGSMETFTLTIQPLLLNYCTKGCHTPQSAGALRLQRIPLTKAGGRYPTQRNLQAALALVDRNKPDESLLLQVPIRPHGTAKVPIFTDREQAQYKQLVQWVYLVANAKQAPPPVSLEERGSPLLQKVPSNEPPPAEPQTKPSQKRGRESFLDGDDEKDSRPLFSEQFRTVRQHGQLVLRPVARRADTAGDFVPKDTFDPEIFNRRYCGR